MRSRIQGQGGFGLIALLVSVGLLGLLSTVITSGTFVMLRTTGRTQANASAVQDLQIATEWLRRDVARANSVSGSANNTFTGLDINFNTVACTYTLIPPLLQRQCATNGTVTDTLIVGHNINGIVFTPNGRDVTIAITGAPGALLGTRSTIFYTRSG